MKYITNYYQHQFNKRNQSDIIKIRVKYGWEGYGLWTAIEEILFENGGRLESETIAEILTIQLNITEKAADEFLDFIVNKTELIQFGDNYYYSIDIKEELESTQKRINRAVNAGKASQQKQREKRDNLSKTYQ